MEEPFMASFEEPLASGQLNPFSCSNCQEISAPQFLFKCEQCTDDLVDSENGLFEYHCETCILVHTMKGHKITNGDGQQPTICDKHNHIHNEYCKTCDTALCSKCLRNHSMHEFESLDQRALDMRSKIEQCLRTLEKHEPKSREMRDTAVIIMRNHKVKVNVLIGYVEQKIEQIKDKIVSEINERFDEFRKAELKIIDWYEANTKLQEDFKSLLNESDVQVVNCLPKLRLDFDDLIENQDELSRLKLNPEKFAGVGCLDNLVTRYEQEAITLLCLPNVFVEMIGGENEDGNDERPEENSFLVGSDLSRCFQITHSRRGICIQEGKIDESGHLERLNPELVEKYESFEIVESVYLLSYNRIRILLLMTNKTAQLFDVDSKLMTPVDYPFVDTFLWPFVHCDQSLNWSYWDEESKVIRFTHSHLLRVPCSDKPFINMSCTSWSCLCFFEPQSCSIFKVDTHDAKFEMIPVSFHGVRDMDACSCYGPDVLILWTVSNKTVTILIKKVDLWSVDKKISWYENANSIYVAITGANCSLRLVPAVANDSVKEPERTENETEGENEINGETEGEIIDAEVVVAEEEKFQFTFLIGW